MSVDSLVEKTLSIVISLGLGSLWCTYSKLLRALCCQPPDSGFKSDSLPFVECFSEDRASTIRPKYD